MTNNDNDNDTTTTTNNDTCDTHNTTNHIL